MKRSKILVFILLLAILLSVFVINVSAHGIYVVNKSTNKYHLPDCSYLPSASNSYTIYRDDIDNYPNLSPCGHCRPDIYHSYEPANPGQSSSDSSNKNNYSDSNSENEVNKSNSDYYSFKNKFLRITQRTIPLILIIYGTLFWIYSGISESFLSKYNLEKLNLALAGILAVSVIIELAVWLLGKFSFYIIEFFL